MKQKEYDQPIIALAPIPPTEGGKFNGKITNDVYTKSGAPSNSVAAIDGVLKGAGFTKVFTEDSRFYPEFGKFLQSDVSRIFQSDILALSGTTRNTDSSLDAARQYKQSNPKGKVIAGGFGPSFEPEKWLLGGVDIVVRGEGDKTAALVAKAITNNDSIEHIKGISYKKDGEIKHNDDSALLTEKELSELPLPFYPDYIKKKRNIHTVNESRGCYGNCQFCCVTVAYQRTYRMKTPERIAAEIRDSRDNEAVFFTGDNLVPRQQRAASRLVAEKLIAEKLFRRYLAQVDASFAEDIDLVKTWKKAGLFAVFQGKESINSEALINIRKPFTAEQSIRSTEILRKLGLFVHDMFVIGIDGDTPETIQYGHYSMGMKQRLGIASTLLRDPELIILDEPTNGLDPAGTKEIRDLIPSLAAESRAILLCSHLLHEVEMVCDHVAIVKQGKVIVDAPMKELLSHGNVLQIKVNDVEKATSALSSLSWIKSVKKEGDYLILDVPQDRSADVNLALAQKGILVSELVNRTASLESVFLELTGGASGD